MEIKLKNKTAIVTGSIQGIGLAIAKILAQSGANVIINSRRDGDVLQIRAEEIASETGAKVKAVLADVTKRDEAQKLIDAAMSMGSTIDILVNNAGGLVKRVPVAEFDEQHFQTVMDINVKSTFLMSHLVMPYMKNKNPAKSLIFLHRLRMTAAVTALRLIRLPKARSGLLPNR